MKEKHKHQHFFFFFFFFFFFKAKLHRFYFIFSILSYKIWTRVTNYFIECTFFLSNKNIYYLKLLFTTGETFRDFKKEKKTVKRAEKQQKFLKSSPTKNG